MELVEIVSQLIFSIVLIVLVWLAVVKYIKYLNQKAIIDYKTYTTGIGIKRYVDETLNEYITESMEEILTTDPMYISAVSLNSELETDLIKKVSKQVLTFMPESFKDQMRMVYDIDRTVNAKGETGLTNIVVRKTYLLVLKSSVAVNSGNNPGDNLQDIANVINNKSE